MMNSAGAAPVADHGQLAMKSELSLSISVIVCTRDRAISLEQMLGAMCAIDLNGINSFELLIIDNGSADHTRNVVESFIKIAPFRVEYLLEVKPGVCFAKNRGLAIARGDLIMFTDDDCIVDPDWAKAAVRVFAGDLLKLVGGRVELFNKKHLPLTIKTSQVPEAMTSTGQIFGFLHGANMACGRAVIEQIGLFDVRLGPGTRFHAADDTDFVYRAFISGVPVRYEPTLVVHHNHGRSGNKQAFRLMRGYAVAIGAMTVKHLLTGRTDLLKPNYWDFLSALRAWRADRSNWCWLFSKIGLVTGASKYLVLASWKKSVQLDAPGTARPPVQDGVSLR